MLYTPTSDRELFIAKVFWGWLALIIWAIPALSGLGVAMIVLVSARAQGFQDANQLGGSAVLPIIVLFYAQVAGVMFFNTTIVLLMGLII